MAKELMMYRAPVQHYGQWLDGFDWSVFGCGSFRKRVTESRARMMMLRFIERLERKVKGDVSYFAMLEGRSPRKGLRGIRPHWHFLASGPVEPGRMAALSKEIWERLCGNAEVVPFDGSRNGAYYASKMAGNGAIVPMGDKLDQLEYRGNRDLLTAAQENSYVPDHLKGKVSGEYLVVRSKE